MYIHATNVAVQKSSPEYDGNRGCKWLLRNFRNYMNTRYGMDRTNRLFNDIEMLIVRALLCVQKLMIQDKHCFELYVLIIHSIILMGFIHSSMRRYGYDVLIDDQLKPWLLEVNASPSLSVENQMDYETKFCVLNDAMDVIDMENR
jgi:tubulin polyglutamylase TTLL9